MSSAGSRIHYWRNQTTTRREQQDRHDDHSRTATVRPVGHVAVPPPTGLRRSPRRSSPGRSGEIEVEHLVRIKTDDPRVLAEETPDEDGVAGSRSNRSCSSASRYRMLILLDCVIASTARRSRTSRWAAKPGAERLPFEFGLERLAPALTLFEVHQAPDRARSSQDRTSAQRRHSLFAILVREENRLEAVHFTPISRLIR